MGRDLEKVKVSSPPSSRSRVAWGDLGGVRPEDDTGWVGSCWELKGSLEGPTS